MKRLKTLFAACLCALLGASVLAGCEKSGGEKPTAPKKATARAEKKSVAKEPSAETTSAAKPTVVDKEEPTRGTIEPKPEIAAKAQVIFETTDDSDHGILAPDPLDSDPPAVPAVEMSARHAATCLVKVGDTMPDARLPNLAGQEQDLSTLLGEKLTVLFFWTSGNRHSVLEMRDLAVKIASPLAPRGVRVIGICERDTTDVAKALADKAGASFPLLIDNDGQYLARVATAHLPRTYVLDATGKIVWFDIEYTPATRRDFRTALRALLPRESTAP